MVISTRGPSSLLGEFIISQLESFPSSLVEGFIISQLDLSDDSILFMMMMRLQFRSVSDDISQSDFRRGFMQMSSGYQTQVNKGRGNEMK